MSVVGNGDVQDIVDLVQSLCEVEIAAIGILDDGEFHYLVTAGVAPLSVPETSTICQHAMGNPDLVLIPDTRADDRTMSSPFVDGTAMALRFYASTPIRDPDGEMVGRLCVFDSRHRELSTVQQHALQTLAESLSTILALRLQPDNAPAGSTRPEDVSVVARVSHDLRLPLATLQASLELLAEATEPVHDTNINRLLSASRRSVSRMSGMVEALLKLHEVTKEPTLRRVNLDEVAAKVLADVAVLVGAADAAVVVDDLPVVDADPDLMYSALLNLVSNALKFARPDVAAQVHLGARRSGNAWRIEVTDNGRGVAPEDREAVFVLFTRLTEAPGHGIGLTTVAQIVRAHGGSCGVEQPARHPEGIGSCFWFELPDREGLRPVSPLPD